MNLKEAGKTEKLMEALLRVVAEEAGSPDNPYLMSRIRARIHEMSRHQGAGSWESAVLALRGWLVAFGAAAILLLSISLQWAGTEPGRRPAVTTDMSTFSAINEDFMRDRFPAPVGESGSIRSKREDAGDALK